ncbi:MAG: hypothetical protein IKB35_04065 [Clostridia bacterium]|nr:hypothetical protein [Clostridia bacterium]
MKKKQASRELTYSDMILNSKPAMLIVSVLAILLGLFFIFYVGQDDTVSREDAVVYTGEFARYESSSNYKILYFKDGTEYSIFPHYETADLSEGLSSLEAGTELFLLVNPKNNYAVEIKTDAKELLNFEASQKAIRSNSNFFIGIGIFACFAGIFLTVYAFGASSYKKKEYARDRKKQEKYTSSRDDIALRRADLSSKGRTLLEATVKEYKICYRRIKSTNELVINGYVYDEKKGIIEFEHNLSARVDSHKFEAGLNSNSYSYIKFDGKIIAEKQRLI